MQWRYLLSYVPATTAQHENVSGEWVSWGASCSEWTAHHGPSTNEQSGVLHGAGHWAPYKASPGAAPCGPAGEKVVAFWSQLSDQRRHFPFVPYSVPDVCITHWSACPVCHVIWQEQLLRKQDEAQVHSVIHFLQKNAMEDIEEHNEKFAAMRGIVEWLKEGQDGLTQAVQQVSPWW